MLLSILAAAALSQVVAPPGEAQSACARIEELTAEGKFAVLIRQEPYPACRAEIANNRHPQIASRLVDGIGKGDRDAQQVLCMLHPPGVTQWMARGLGNDRTAGLCLAGLAEENSAESNQAVESYLEAFRYREVGTLNPAVAEAARHSRRLALRVSHWLLELSEHHTGGYDTLRDAVCGEADAPWSNTASVCHFAAPRLEAGWSQPHKRMVRRKIGDTAFLIGFAGAFTAVGWVTRNDRFGQFLAASMFAAGTAVSVDAAVQRSRAEMVPGASPAIGILVAVPAALVGYFAAYHTGAPRAVVTGVGAIGIVVGGSFDIWQHHVLIDPCAAANFPRRRRVGPNGYAADAPAASGNLNGGAKG
jgi:hypothetical protein